MKTICLRLFVFATILSLLNKQVKAQGRFKIGGGYSIISNEAEAPGFYTFAAGTLYTAYSFINYSSLSVGAEGFLSFRSKEDEDEHVERNGFAFALPLTANLQIWRLHFSAGAGPAYVRQSLVYENPTRKRKIGGWYRDITGGLGLGLKDNPNVMVNVRLHYLKSYSQKRDDGAMLSLLLIGIVD